MIQKDLLCVWPIHLDFPIFRQQIRDQRKYFNRVIISFTKMNALGDFRGFVREAMVPDNITFVDNEPASADQDWRDTATRKALEYSDSEWVLFTEQDFIIYNHGLFWKMVEDLALPPTEVLGYLQDKRLHPCFLLIKRTILDKTSKNFGVVKDKSDHFSIIAQELEKVPKSYIIESQQNRIFHHMNGLSQNMYLLQEGLTPNYNPSEFYQYLANCLEVEVPMDPDFKDFITRCVKN